MKSRLGFVLAILTALSALAQDAAPPRAPDSRWVKVAAISLLWEPGERTLDRTLAALD